MSEEKRKRLIGLVVGEVSGDALGGKLVSALRARFPQDHLDFIGTGGPALSARHGLFVSFV